MKLTTQKQVDNLERRSDGYIHIPDESVIGNGLVFPDKVKFGNYAKIGNGAKIGNHARIGDYATVGGCAKIGNDATIGDDAIIGNHARIGDGAKIGNYAKIGDGSIAKSIFWGEMKLPPIKVEGYIYPPADRRGHWTERLSEFVDITECGCYESIVEKMRPYRKEILKSNKWTPVERLILEKFLKKEVYNV